MAQPCNYITPLVQFGVTRTRSSCGEIARERGAALIKEEIANAQFRCRHEGSGLASEAQSRGERAGASGGAVESRSAGAAQAERP